MIRIVAPEGNYDYQNKYFTDDTQYLCPSGLPAAEEAEIQRIVAARLPRAGLPRLGPRRPDDARERPQALPARDEHLAGHDRPLAGADVGPGRGHQLRAAVPACCCATPRWTPERRCRTMTHRRPAPSAPRPRLPLDVRLMNSTATLLFALLAARCWRRSRWLGGARSRRSRIRAHPRRGRRDAQQRGDDPRQRAAAGCRATSSRSTCSRRSAAFEAVPWVRRRWCSASGPNRLAVRLRSTGRRVVGRRRATTRLVNSFGEVFEANLGDVEDDDLPRWQGPEGSAPQCWRCCARLQPVFARARCAHRRRCALSARGSLARRARQRRRDRARPRQRRRGGRAHRALRRAR